PFLILFIGVAVVIGMIIGMRINAFVALITAALVVSFLSPGEIADKVSRVASAFGATAGGIGIVIALAAVIGKCLMDSGAADRVVQAFVKGMGEKRSSIALSGSGFVLSIPVFFDTVFYLLVPLARSLYRSTKKNYLKYVLAISAGAAVTHTLVPPTPGPLLMAQQLGVDLGTMIGVGALVGIPAAIVGLLFAGWLDKRMPIEMRPLPGEEESETVEISDRKLPGLFVSLLPILLPVVLIGMNTALETKANGERAAQITEGDIKDATALKAAIALATEAPLLALKDADVHESDDLAAAINEALIDRQAFATGKNLGRSNLALVENANRSALEAVLPEAVLARHVWDTPARKAANVSKLYGNANLALLLSAVIAILLYVRSCKPSKTQFSDMLEHALMSGGLIILITAAGGAFGAMLAAAGIGEAIQARFASAGASMGISLLCLAFFISLVMKIAQGSTTVAVITASGMISAMLVGVDLSFHSVYLATAIGGGGLVGSWMNDSGFWIFSKMSGLTEAEALKSWTPLLAVLGVTAFLMSVLLSFVLPLA
ncbi:MAG: GntP family permease, partial [Verrucomicrobiales bacterium]|nr:GntP family permease [Verrucomicrobiales bacterium]